MPITPVPGTRRTSASSVGKDSPIQELIAFTSMCPRCAVEQPQRGFSRADLHRLLDDGYPVEAYCVLCDEFWPISVSERAALARALTG